MGAFTSDAPPVAAALAGFFGWAAAGAAVELVALSDGLCDQASGAQLSSAATAIAVLWKKRSGARSFLGPTAEFMKHLVLAGQAHGHGGNRSGRQFRLSGSAVLRFFRVGNWRRELKREVVEGQC